MRWLILICFCLNFILAYATPQNRNWNDWVQELRQEVVAQGINPNLFDDLFRNIQPNKRILRFDRTQPEKRITFLQYRKSRIDNYRIQLGVKEFKNHRELVEDIGKQYSVNPCFIIALWGIESSYGRYMGDFHVIKALATLAYDDRRADFFRSELIIALHILNDGHVDEDHFKGEWAGASGHPQFLPSSWKQYAVDHTNDGKKDIWRNLPDAFASIANYLKQNGWQAGQPWGIQVQLPVHFPKDLIGLKIKKPVSEWLQLGVKPAYNEQLPAGDLPASIIFPDGGPSFMVFNNFRTLMRYNNSIFYAASVGYLGDEICKRSRHKMVF